VCNFHPTITIILVRSTGPSVYVVIVGLKIMRLFRHTFNKVSAFRGLGGHLLFFFCSKIFRIT
jgi:hypothetical protein